MKYTNRQRGSLDAPELIMLICAIALAAIFVAEKISDRLDKIIAVIEPMQKDCTLTAIATKLEDGRVFRSIICEGVK